MFSWEGEQYEPDSERCYFRHQAPDGTQAGGDAEDLVDVSFQGRESCDASDTVDVGIVNCEMYDMNDLVDVGIVNDERFDDRYDGVDVQIGGYAENDGDDAIKVDQGPVLINYCAIS